MLDSAIQPVYEDIGRRIRLFRESQGLTQAELAEASALTRTSIVNIERGRQRFLVHTLIDLARVLRIDPQDLLPAGEEVQPLMAPREAIIARFPSVEVAVDKGKRLKKRRGYDDGSQAKGPRIG